MKVCTRCKLPKEVSEFHKHCKSKDGFASQCKACKKIIDAKSHQRYQKNRAAKRKIDRLSHRKWLHSLKDNKPCADCGVRHRWWRLDWDHLPGKKKLFCLGNADRVVGDKGRAKILEEIAKCELVCANCHRDRTHQRLYELQGS